MSVHVGQLWHYPVKSMQGEPTDEVIVGPGGVVGDRAYGFIDVEAGRLISAKHPKRYAPILECRAAFTEPPKLDAGLPPVRVTFPDGTTVDGDHDEITARVGKLLGCEVRLATVSVDAEILMEEVWPDLEGFGPGDFYRMLQIGTEADDPAGERILGFRPAMAAPGSLNDLAAMHVITTSTLATLSAEHPGGQWDVRRFRPNILFDDGSRAGVNGEDEWIGQDLQLGDGARIHIVASTPRCIMTTLGQADLPRDPEVLRTMARANRRPLGPFGLFAAAGAYAEVVTPGAVRVGDPVAVESSTAPDGPLAHVMAAMAAALGV
ncbi:MAG TPA: MOSC domain-containing protein [Acidimicrobiia bacterium]|nr:MOSC domain-containing protein [Acidimicrobiia bacterium]